MMILVSASDVESANGSPVDEWAVLGASAITL